MAMQKEELSVPRYVYPELRRVVETRPPAPGGMLANEQGKRLVSTARLHEMEEKLTAQRMTVAMAWVGGVQTIQ